MDTKALLILLGPVAGIVVGWWLNRWSTSWQWRREALLRSYVGVLAAADHSSDLSGDAFGKRLGHPVTDLDPAIVAAAKAALMEVDRAASELRLLGNRQTASLSLNLYVQCDRLFRAALVEECLSTEEYLEVGATMSKAHQALIDHGRRELNFARSIWRSLRPEPDFYAEADQAITRLNAEFRISPRASKPTDAQG
jgi:hypothetical protein